MDWADSRIDQSSTSHDGLSFQKRMSDSTQGFEMGLALESIIIDCYFQPWEYPRSRLKFNDPFVTEVRLECPNLSRSLSLRIVYFLAATSFSHTARYAD